MIVTRSFRVPPGWNSCGAAKIQARGRRSCVRPSWGRYLRRHALGGWPRLPCSRSVIPGAHASFVGQVVLQFEFAVAHVERDGCKTVCEAADHCSGVCHTIPGRSGSERDGNGKTHKKKPPIALRQTGPPPSTTVPRKANSDSTELEPVLQRRASERERHRASKPAAKQSAWVSAEPTRLAAQQFSIGLGGESTQFYFSLRLSSSSSQWRLLLLLLLVLLSACHLHAGCLISLR
ncbi:hydrolase [Anopheles sinensis]|uniref:Hydrolase n=1 Tax=Anopheles sinensis TaxID=74873 RepID=A0A084VUF7_ANOSI|nr:hydrolase [Anopheles sinensis]